MLVTRNPTSNTTPDPGQGGSAVTTPTNTGHGNTTVNVSNGASLARTCIWSGVQNVAGTKTSVRLKMSWSINGSLEAAGINQFTLEYSLNGGGAWITAVLRDNVVAPDSGSVDVALTNTQDLTQVHVRDKLTANADIGAGVDAAINGSISNIRVEVTTSDAFAVSGGMM